MHTINHNLDKNPEYTYL